MPTSTPCAARRVARARPIPLEAPVMNAVRNVIGRACTARASPQPGSASRVRQSDRAVVNPGEDHLGGADGRLALELLPIVAAPSPGDVSDTEHRRARHARA